MILPFTQLSRMVLAQQISEEFPKVENKSKGFREVQKYLNNNKK